MTKELTLKRDKWVDTPAGKYMLFHYYEWGEGHIAMPIPRELYEQLGKPKQINVTVEVL